MEKKNKEMRKMSRVNSYMYDFGMDLYCAMPKSVIAAVAFSLALRLCEDNYDRAKQLIKSEWKILFKYGIVSQKPRIK
jgi:hypothetical protein